MSRRLEQIRQHVLADGAVEALPGEALRARIEETAYYVGLLRRRFASNEAWSAEWLVDELSGCVESLDCMTQRPAAELVPSLTAEAGGDQDLAVQEALAITDRRQADVRRLLGIRGR